MGYCELFVAKTRDINKDKVDFLHLDRYADRFSANTLALFFAIMFNVMEQSSLLISWNAA